jgi:hypothetical protein
MRSATKGILLAVVMATLLHDAGGGQDVGKVARIAEKQGEDLKETKRAEIWSTGAEFRSQVRQNAPLLVRDLVRLRERIIVGLDLWQPGFATRVYLGSHKLSPVGGFEILPGTVSSLSALQLVVKQGVMVVEHARGELLVVANGISTKILSTTVLFEVDSLAKTGIVFLQEGHIRFPAYDVEGIGQNRAWRLRPNQPPEEFVPTGNQLKQWRHEVQYSTQSVWHRTPFWQKPSFLLPAAAVLAGGIGCVAAGCLDGGGSNVDVPGTSRGGVDITIP